MPKYKKSKTELSEKTSKNLRSSINNLLLERGISKTCLSATTGIELSTLSRKISGKNEFTISELIEIAIFFMFLLILYVKGIIFLPYHHCNHLHIL